MEKIILIAFIAAMLVATANAQVDKYGWTYDSSTNTYRDPHLGQTYTLNPTMPGMYEAPSSARVGYTTDYNPRTGQAIIFTDQGTPYRAFEYSDRGTGTYTTTDITAQSPQYQRFLTSAPQAAPAAGTAPGAPTVPGQPPTAPGGLEGFERVSAAPAQPGVQAGPGRPAAPGATYTYQGQQIQVSQASWYFYNGEFIKPTQGGVTVPAGSTPVPQSVVSNANTYGVQSVQRQASGLVFNFNPKPSVDTGLLEDVRTTTTTQITVRQDGSATIRTTDAIARCTSNCQSDENWKQEPQLTQSSSITTQQVTQAGRTRTTIAGRTTYYYDSEGKPTGSLTTNYNPQTGTATSVAVRDRDDRVVTTVDSTGQHDQSLTDAWSGVSEQQRGQIQRTAVSQSVNAGVLTGFDAASALTFGQNIGRVFRAYRTFSGLTQLSSLIWPRRAERLQALRDTISQEFCVAAGIQNCVRSAICGSIVDINAGNVLVGRGPGGQYVSSASLNAERSLPLEVAGLTRQQLIDLFGNTTIIGGRRINLTDPKFDPKNLGAMKIRMYHVQYGITNNLQRVLHWNMEFAISPANVNTSYGEPITSRNWFSEDMSMNVSETVTDNKYKLSATEYTDVCLKFSPPLPSGHALIASMADKLCVPITEYQGGPTTFEAKQSAEGAAQEAPSEGGNI